MIQKEINVDVPYKFTPRKYQDPIIWALGDKGFKRAIYVWHRRAGKDKVAINIVAKEVYRRVGLYYYLFPTYKQGKKIIWTGADKDGFRHLDHFPKETIVRKDNIDMSLEFSNGSIFQIVGTDNIDSIMGPNPVGCVFSEFSLQDPASWVYISPILAENDGWALFNFTPRGRNHAYQLLEQNRHNKKTWFIQILTVDDTIDHDGTPAITKKALKLARDSGMSDDKYQQEYYCSFDAALSSCFFRGVLDGHKYIQQGHIGKLKKNNKGELEFEFDEDGDLEIWRYPYYTHKKWDKIPWTYRYVIGSDIGEGLKQDYSVAYVYDRVENDFVARMRSNEIDSFTWADMVRELSIYYENCLIIPERTGAGITTCQRLQKKRANVYIDRTSAKVGSGMTKTIGWVSTTEKKRLICGHLKEYLQDCQKKKSGLIYDYLILSECGCFVEDEKTKRLGADIESAVNDDCVIAAALAIFGSLELPLVKQVIPESEGWRQQLQGTGEKAWTS